MKGDKEIRSNFPFIGLFSGMSQGQSSTLKTFSKFEKLCGLINLVLILFLEGLFFYFYVCDMF